MEMLELPVFEEYTFWELLQKRIIDFNQSVDSSLVERAIIQILKWNQEDDGAQEKDPDETRKPITILLNTDGGDVFTGLVLCDVIKQSKTPVNIDVVVWAGSMGSLICAVGHRRRAWPHSNFLIHSGQMNIQGDSDKVEDLMKYAKQVKGKQMKDLLKEHTNITDKLYKKKERADWWIGAQEALDLGLIDEIIGG